MRLKTLDNWSVVKIICTLHVQYIMSLHIVSGYINLTWPIIEGPVHSIYTFMKERNRCNHRDYQNLGVNGKGV